MKILKLSLYRFDPEKDDRPYMSDHSIKMEGHGNMMVIDAIRKAQEKIQQSPLEGLVPKEFVVQME